MRDECHVSNQGERGAETTKILSILTNNRYLALGRAETENVELKCKYNITGVLCTGLYIMVHLEYKVFHK